MAVDRADVAVIVIDATVGFTEQDSKVADNYRKHTLCKVTQQRCHRRSFSEYSQNIGQTCVVASVITDILML